MKTVIVKVYNDVENISEVQVQTKDGKPTIIKAGKGVNYDFYDQSIDKAPNHIVNRRVDNDLHISFEREGTETDLIIEDFYSNEDQALIGMAEDGEYYYYVPDTGEVYDYVTQLQTGDVEGHALGGKNIEPLWVALPVEAAAKAGIPWWLLGLALPALPLLLNKKKDEETTDVDAPAQPPIELQKASELQVAEGETAKVGDKILYTFTVTNNSEYTISDISISDTTIGLDNIVVTPSELVAGAKATATATYILTQDDINAGKVENTATVKGTDPEGNEVTDTSDSTNPGDADGASNNTSSPLSNDGDNGNDPTVVSLSPAPQDVAKIELLKSSTVAADATVGDKIDYTFTVTNTGDFILKDISITDEKLGLDKLVVDTDQLKPGQSATVTAEYTLTQADIDAGKVENTATVMATDPSGNEVTDVSDSGNSNDADKAGTDDPTITLLGPNQPPSSPSLAPDVDDAPEVGKAHTLDILENDIADGDNINPESVQFVDANNETSKELVVDNEGTWVVDNQGNVTFTPLDSFTTSPTAVKYIAADLEGNLAQATTITINYPSSTPANPVASSAPNTGDVNYLFIPEITADYAIPWGCNDFDSDSDIDKTTVKLLDATGAEVTSLQVAEGTWTVTPELSAIKFAANDANSETPEPVEYVVYDADGNRSTPAKINFVRPGESADGNFDGDIVNLTQQDAIDFTGLENVEKLNLKNETEQTLELSVADVLGMTDDNRTLFIDADSNDTIKLSGFTSEEDAGLDCSYDAHNSEYNMYVGESARIYVHQSVEDVVII